ncbi:hypothetical protein EDD21DRAFT_372963 [Dissophora ornata]|nr:hypothetical protein EDD21DRAFT_372963 [Dissophora ornata]
MHHSATKETDLLRQKEKALELENAKSLENAACQSDIIESLQSKLERSNIEREVEYRASAERTKELEARCRAMESAFNEMFEKSGSTQKIDETQPHDIWQQHSAAVLDILVYHTTECSVSKTEYTTLLEENSALKQSSAALAATLQEQEATFKKAQTDHSGLLTKIAELEDRVRHLTGEVEFLEAESIGKVAIIKALQDEYDYQEKVIRDLSKNEDAGKEVTRLEEELRMMTARTQETEAWIKEVKEDNEKYRQAYVKADVAREATLLDMAKLHEELAESEQARLQVENQLQTEVRAMIKKHGLTGDELSRLSKMNVDSAQNLNLKQKIKQVVQLKEEVLALKKKNLGLSNTRDSLRLKCLQVERELEAYKAANVSNAVTAPASSTGARSRASSVVSSTSTVRSVSATTMVVASDQTSGGKLQLQGLVPLAPSSRSRSTSPGTTKPSKGVSQPAIRSRAARSFMAGHSTTS